MKARIAAENSIKTYSPSKTYSASLSNSKAFEGSQVHTFEANKVPELTVKAQTSDKANEPEQTPKSEIYFEEVKELKNLDHKSQTAQPKATG